MKNLKVFFLGILLSLGMTNCSDPCKDVNCANGNCDEGICNCVAGYEGTLCDTEIRTKYYGIYTADISSCIPDVGLGQGGIDLTQLGALTTVSLIVSPAGNVEFVNLSSTSAIVNFNEDVSITSNFFTIPPTTTTIDDPNLLPIAINLTANGLGEFVDSNTITMDLVVAISLDVIPFPLSQNCTIVFTK
jgi:hypothetical protein